MEEAPAARSRVWHGAHTCHTRLASAVSGTGLQCEQVNSCCLSPTPAAQSASWSRPWFELLEKVGRLQQTFLGLGPRVCSWV